LLINSNETIQSPQEQRDFLPSISPELDLMAATISGLLEKKEML
jgi:hypothetical protein